MAAKGCGIELPVQVHNPKGESAEQINMRAGALETDVRTFIL
jgi:hypothetical protein